jgi:hypothetical protein
MEVGQGQNWGCSAKEKESTSSEKIGNEDTESRRLMQSIKSI